MKLLFLVCLFALVIPYISANSAKCECAGGCDKGCYCSVEWANICGCFCDGGVTEPPPCNDVWNDCSVYANFCNNTNYYKSMCQNCKSTCNLCNETCS
uniref:ShKT domain-containing protein n=1 Tax=Acrobeloides nanus TaxID=290746 RepID=A0A914E0Y5_9BILA